MSFDSSPMRAQRTDALPSGISASREFTDTLGPVPTDNKRTELNSVYNELAQSVERVHRLAQVLESRLVDVTLPIEASNSSVKEPCAVYSTRVAAAFSEQVRILNNIAAGIDSILNRLEV